MSVSRSSCAAAALLLLVACHTPQPPAPEPQTSYESRAVVREHAPPPSWTTPVAPTPVAPTRRESENAAVHRKLRTSTINDVSLTEETGDYLEVVKLLRTVSGIPIVVSAEARATIRAENLVFVIDIVAPVQVANVLDLMVGRSENLGWLVRNGVVELTTKAKARGDVTLFTHDIRDLVFPRTEFLPPVIRDIPAGETTARSGSEGDEKVSALEPDQIVAMVKRGTNAEYWDTEGGGTIEFVDSGYLLVNASPAMQRRVAGLLNRLR